MQGRSWKVGFPLLRAILLKALLSTVYTKSSRFVHFANYCELFVAVLNQKFKRDKKKKKDEVEGEGEGEAENEEEDENTHNPWRYKWIRFKTRRVSKDVNMIYFRRTKKVEKF